MKFTKLVSLCLVGTLLVGYALANDIRWKKMVMQTAYIAGTEALKAIDEGDSLNGASACVVAVLGQICATAAAVGCVAVPAAPTVCSSTRAMLGLKISISVIWAVAIKACDSVGSDFNGHTSAMNCDAASYLAFHPPPNGVPADVRSFYKKQCSDECTDPRKCKR
ncbi:MAG: hypothetical protein BYD32DRAFT_441218 [Podila humilis]|nr:MAG: hypothetical protein BYD32DRAFT_441218 [Podila humilis]